ncbi:MAG: Ig-like domain-containing protein [Phycisphaerales bacterium]|nr:Ig-like domain-containing protein [Phycisphaerales bacterium]
MDIKGFQLLEPGETVFVEWDARDDGSIVEHRLFYSPGLNYQPENAILITAGIAGTQRSYQWTVPDVGPLLSSPETNLYVVAIDDAGQEGWDRHAYVIPDNDRPGEVTISGPSAGASYLAGDFIPFTYESSGFTDGYFALFNAALVLENDDAWEFGFGSGIPDGFFAPCVSTDAARVVVIAQGTYNIQKHFFSEVFTIRPDPRIGDAPPAITMLSPLDGQSFAGTVPISWSASDDLGIREIKIYASTNQGRSWQRVVTELPGPATSYVWRPVADVAAADVRVKVVAVDTRFQNTSDGRDRVISILPGSGGPCPADWNDSGSVTGADITAFLQDWFADIAGGTSLADFNNSGSTTSADITAFLSAWFTALASGC